MEIKEDEREVSVTQEEIGAFEGLFGFGTAEPDEVAAFFVPVRGGVEGVATIDESEREVAFFVEEFGNDERGSSGVARGDDFAEMAGGKFERSGLGNGLFGNRCAMSGRELLTKLSAELVDLQDAQNMFIRTLFKYESRRWRSNRELGNIHGKWKVVDRNWLTATVSSHVQVIFSSGVTDAVGCRRSDRWDVSRAALGKWGRVLRSSSCRRGIFWGLHLF